MMPLSRSSNALSTKSPTNMTTRRITTQRSSVMPKLVLCWSATVASAVALLWVVAPAQAATASWSLSPSSYDFGTRLPEAGPSAPAVFTLTNTGEVQLPSPVLDAATSTEDGPEPGVFEFASDQCEGGAGLPPSASCTIEVTFDPLYPGARNGRLTFSDPSSQVAPISATYSGVGLGPIVSVSPPSVQFHSLLVGEGPSIARVLTLTNSGDLDLAITAISLENAVDANAPQFAVAGGSCRPGGTVAPGSSCTIQLTFSPTTVGFMSAELLIADNAAHGHQLVRMEGLGAGLLPTKPPPLATFISHSPPRLTRKRFAIFGFGVAGGHVQFACRLDQRPYRRCASPKTYTHLAIGRHVFRVRTLGRVTDVSPAPAVARFRVIAKHRARPGRHAAASR
jgi:hypothetical protein